MPLLIADLAPTRSQNETTVGSGALWAVVGALFAVSVPQWGIYHSNGCFFTRLLEVKARSSTVIFFPPSLRKLEPKAGLQQSNKRRRGKENQEKRRECKAGPDHQPGTSQLVPSEFAF